MDLTASSAVNLPISSTLTVGCRPDGSPINPLHVSEDSITTVHFYDKSGIFHRSSSRRMTNKMGGDIKPPPISVTGYSSYAAMLGAWASTVFSPPTLTLICVGLASTLLARFIFSTPLSHWALTCPGSTELGSVNGPGKASRSAARRDGSSLLFLPSRSCARHGR